MGLTDKLAASRKSKLTEYLNAELPEAGEIEGMIPMVQTGRASGFFGVAITTGQVVIVTYPRMSETPNGVFGAYPRNAVKVEKWKTGMVTSALELAIPDSRFAVKVPRIHREDGEAIVAALGGAPA